MDISVAAREKLEREKEKLRLKERSIMEKEKRQRIKLFIEIGRIASQAGIDHLDKDLILGAFLEISAKLASHESKDDWKMRAAEFKNKQDNQQGLPLSVCFKSLPPTEIRQQLKQLGLRWNGFRKEFFGHAIKEELQKIVKEFDAKIEVVT